MGNIPMDEVFKIAESIILTENRLNICEEAQTPERFFVKIDKNRKSCNKPVICCVIWIKGFIERSRR